VSGRPVDPGRPTLATERLILRPLRPGDAADVQRLAGSRAVADTALHVPHPFGDGVAEAWIASDPVRYEEGRSVVFAVTLRSHGALVGAIGLSGIAPNHRAELGYWIGEPFWGRGYATEAARPVLAYAFERLSLIRVHANHLARNPASGRVLSKIGMRREGVLRRHVRHLGALEDVVLHACLADEANRGA
jgi:[ribosomal protein S5]-alanine N-acetyltransferase